MHTPKSTHNNITWDKFINVTCCGSHFIFFLFFLSLVLVWLLMRKVLVKFPYVASPVLSWLADRSTLCGRWVQTEWASCRLLNFLLCWLGQVHPLFVLDSGFVGEDWVGRELACRNCVRGCVGLFRVHSYCTHMHRERLYGITTSLLAREAASACLSSSETELTGLREERHPSFFFFFFF